jgi:hypothetical protein
MTREKITLMFNPDLKKEIDHIAIDEGVYPCEILERIVKLGLQTLKEKSNAATEKHWKKLF